MANYLLGHNYLASEDPRIRAFLDEIITVCKKHGYSIDFDDGYEWFYVEKFNSLINDRLYAARIGTSIKIPR